MAVQGIFSSDSDINGNRVQNFPSALLKEVPTGSAPLLALSAGMKSVDTNETMATWFEETHLSGQGTVVNDAGLGTTLIFADGSFYPRSTIIQVSDSGELILVESMTGNSAVVARGLGGTVPTAINGSATAVAVQRIATANEEGSGRPVEIAQVGYPRINYYQIFRNAWGLTGTAKAVDFHTEGRLGKNKRDSMLFHSEDIERAILHSRQSIGVKDGKPFRLMDGIIPQLKTNNQIAVNGEVSWLTLNSFLQKIFEKNIKGAPNERIAFSGNQVITALNDIARLEGTIDLRVGQTEFGMEVTKWITPFGRISLMSHPLFNESPFWTKDLLVLHPSAIEMRWLRRTFSDDYTEDGTRGGVDADYGIYTSELTVTYKSEKTGGLFRNISTGVGTA